MYIFPPPNQLFFGSAVALFWITYFVSRGNEAGSGGNQSNISAASDGPESSTQSGTDGNEAVEEEAEDWDVCS